MIIEVTVPIRCDPANPPGYTEILHIHVAEETYKKVKISGVGVRT